MRASDVHPSHDVRDEGCLGADPVCQKCRASVHENAALLRTACPAAIRATEAQATDACYDATQADREEAIKLHGSGWIEDLELVAKGIAHGRAAERVEIAAWLRYTCGHLEGAAVASGLSGMKAPINSIRALADAIEALEHKEPRDA